MENEIWKDISNAPGYQVSTLGRIKSFKRKQEKIIIHRLINGYPVVGITENGKRREIKIHRIVAKEFIPNLENKPQVNHKDGNKQNNKVENLEWCTREENMQHAFKNGLAKKIQDVCPKYWLGKKGKNNPFYGKKKNKNKHSVEVS